MSEFVKGLKKEVKLFVIAECCMLGIYVISVFLPYNLQQLIDTGIYWHDEKEIFICLVKFAGCFLGYLVFQSVFSYIWQLIYNRYLVDVKVEVMKSILAMNTEDRMKLDTGDLMHRIDWEADQYIHMIMKNGFHFINSAILIILILVIVGRKSVMIAGLLLGGAIVPIIISRVQKKKAQTHYQAAREKNAEFLQKVMMCLAGKSVIKFSGSEFQCEESVEVLSKGYIEEENKGIKIDFFTDKLIYAWNLIVSIMIYMYSYILFQKGQFSVGYLIAVIEYIALLHKKLNWMLRIYLDYEVRKKSIQRVNEILSSEKEDLTGTKIGSIKKIDLKNVGYRFGEKWVFQNINGCIKKGMKVAITGMSGAGKTTLLSIMEGIFTDYVGEIWIGDSELKSCSIESIREKMSIIVQNPLWNCNHIGEYLRQKNPNCAEKEIRQVKDKFLLSDCPDSAEFSGGEKQRIQIAGMMMKKADVYIMDEATSALDLEMENKILKKVFAMTKNKILIVVTHRQEQLGKFDYVLDIEKGTLTCQNQ